MKECRKCGELKPLDQFYYRKDSGTHRADCKACVIAASRKSQLRNREHRKEYLRDWVDRNREDFREYQREYQRKWRANNPDRASESWRRHHKKMMQNPGYRVSESVSSGIRRCIKNRKGGAKWEAIVGYSVGELIQHLEKQFTDGMTWDNYGDWHIDHIVPVSSFDMSDESDFRACWSISNLRPLWAVDNMKKRDKIEFLV